jgi:hypothetical protein
MMPAEYWKLMVSYTDNSPSGYGMAIYTVGSVHSERRNLFTAMDNALAAAAS